MKVVVFSDNHGDINSVKKILEYNKDADYIISLGDSSFKKSFFEEYNIIGVKGNYPLEPDFPYEKVININGMRIFLTHGHKYNVKFSLTRLYLRVLEMKCDIALFGHTHVAIKTFKDNILFLNPGSTALPRTHDKATYAVLDINDYIISNHYYVEDNSLVK